MNNSSLYDAFVDPPRKFGMVPFWFWNDDVTEDELLRQLDEMYEKGCGGVLIHPRIGLSRRVGYLTDEYFRLVRTVVEKAEQLGMMVILYDEGSYPSGSAQGRVVAEDPSYAARCLIAHGKIVEGPAKGFWHPNPGRALNDELLSVVAARETESGTVDPSSIIRLSVHPPEMAQYDLPAGTWHLLAFWHVYSGGTIRGVFADEEDNHATAPPAGDILNPHAVASFMRHTHEQYAHHIGEHFGKTVMALFTDEPMVFGRSAHRRGKLGNGESAGPWPFTPGFLDDLQQGWNDENQADIHCWLPALWFDCGSRTEAFRLHYEKTVHDRLERIFYAPQGEWCAANGLALTGHPEASNDFGALRQFQWPGQDMVWRWVTPGAESAMIGAHSCAPKVASSAAVIQGSWRNITEVFGAYGWQMTFDEAKWLLDWHMVRGTNLIIPHAFFYSIRERRAYESEPDVGLHNVWWNDFQHLGDYTRRLCWLLSDGELICDVAILTDGNSAAWTAAKQLMEAQIDFVYIDEVALQDAVIEKGKLRVGEQLFQAVICDPPQEEAPPSIVAFAKQGGCVLANWQADSLVTDVRQRVEPDLHWPSQPDLRAIHYAKEGRDLYLLVNEGDAAIEGALSLSATGGLELWDPLSGEIQPWPATLADGRLHTHLHLDRRQGLLLAVNPQESSDATIAYPPQPTQQVEALTLAWSALDADGGCLQLPCPGDWAQEPGWELFSGTVYFETSITFTDEQIDKPLFLDLGKVGEIAELFINGNSLGLCGWAPHRWRVDEHIAVGKNHVVVRVTNSIENRFEGSQRPSGILGPVTLWK